MGQAVGLVAKGLYAVSAVAAMLLGVTFSRAHRRRYRPLQVLHGKQAQIFLVAAGAVIVALPLDILGDHLNTLEEQRTTERLLARVQAIFGKDAVPGGATAIAVTIQADRLGAAVSLAIRSEESFQREDYDEALTYLREADRLAAIAPIKARIADCFFHLGDYVKAIEFENQAITLAPEWSGPYYIVGLSYWRLGRIEDGRGALRKACQRGFDPACKLLE